MVYIRAMKTGQPLQMSIAPLIVTAIVANIPHPLLAGGGAVTVGEQKFLQRYSAAGKRDNFPGVLVEKATVAACNTENRHKNHAHSPRKFEMRNIGFIQSVLASPNSTLPNKLNILLNNVKRKSNLTLTGKE